MIFRNLLIGGALLAQAPLLYGQAASTMAFTVSMPEPANHIFHVVFRCTGLTGETQDFKMPVWSPGYYGIGDYAKNVSNFRAEDAAGHVLPWEKVTKNTWRVATSGAKAMTLNYDVFGPRAFAANNFLGESRAYISPSGLFVHVAGHLDHSATIAIQLPPSWTRIATGLEPVAGHPNTFSAPDFDVLYDSPLLLGNQELLRFDVKGVPHFVAMENVPASVDRNKMVADLKQMVQTATRLIGDVPYRHYTFLMMGTGNGGIEHLNSASIAFNGNSLTTESGYRGWLSYVCHEYFHNFNVKRIRPMALGPFNYDMENLTNMLWVSEGLSVYYQDLVLVRAGLLSSAQYLDKLQNSMAKFENASGRHYQSATESSMNTWSSGSGVGGDRNTTISYYDNGAMLGAMLDLKIRHESKNRKSLDDVMRGLYRKYYLEKKRGFTDAEFWAECESAAGGELHELSGYVSTSATYDYAKYFAYAGLEVEVNAQDASGASLGVNTDMVDGKLVAANSMLWIGAGDQIVEVEGAKATPKALNDLLAAKKSGDKLKLKIAQAGATEDVEVMLVQNVKRTFSFKPVPGPDPLAAAILKDWLRPVE